MKLRWMILCATVPVFAAAALPFAAGYSAVPVRVDRIEIVGLSEQRTSCSGRGGSRTSCSKYHEADLAIAPPDGRVDISAHCVKRLGLAAGKSMPVTVFRRSMFGVVREVYDLHGSVRAICTSY